MKEEKFKYTRNPLHWRRQALGQGEAWVPGRRVQQQGCIGQSGEIPAQRISDTSTHQPERLVCSPTRADVGWERRLRLWRSDPRERTGVSCVNTN